ncbi:MAG: hypothetical protein NC328_03250 [Muribaculum sp.]|nr:hypothetical protein [Muribaculum sp.]
MKFNIVTLLILLTAFCGPAYAVENDNRSVASDEDSCATETIQSAIDACILLAEAAESENADDIRKARQALEECGLASFASLRQEGKSDDESLKGHLVFDATFADSLLTTGKDAYRNADIISKTGTKRGQTKPGKIMTKTFLIKANGKSTYKFNSHNRQELAVVAEPGGRVTTRVHAVNKTKGIDEWHNDTTDVAKGRSNRKTAFTLPQSPASQVTLEITNCTNKDISVVIISN